MFLHSVVRTTADRISSRLGLVAVAVLAGALLVGLFARSQGLEIRPLAVDEYYMARSAEFILERGVPTFPTGGDYRRGLPLQYLMAASAVVFGQNEFAYRLPTVVFSLLSVVLAYCYARRFTSAPVAGAVAGALLLSSWHIEFAQFARMYAYLQFLTLLFLIAIDDAFFGGGWRRRYLPHLALVPLSLAHSAGALLAPLLFLPLITERGAGSRFRTWGARLRFGAVGLAISVLCVGYVVVGPFGSDLVDRYPAGYTPVIGVSPLSLPVFPFWHLEGDPEATLLLLAGVVALVLGVLWLLRWSGRTINQVDPWLAGLVLLSAVHLFTLAGVVLSVLLVRHDLHRPARHPRRAYVLLLTAALIGGGWLTVALIASDGLATPEIMAKWWGADTPFWKALWTTFFGWPDVYATTVRPFAVEMPVLGVLALGATGYLLIVHRHAPMPALLRLPWLVIVMTMLTFGIFEAPESRLRYWFHLYPVILCLIAIAVEDLARRLPRRWNPVRQHVGYVAALGFFGVFTLTSDFNPRHILQTGSDPVGYRTGPFADFWVTWYWRYDYRSPAQFVQANAATDDATRVVVEFDFPASYYLARDHAIYLPRGLEVFDLHAVKRGTVDRWSNRRLLSTPEELAAYTDAASDVWLIRSVDRTRVPGLPRIGEVWGARVLEQERAFLSHDGRLEVVHVRLPRG